MAKVAYQTAKKHCRKFQPAEHGARTLYRHTTDGRAIAYSEREREFTFAKNDTLAFSRTDVGQNPWLHDTI